MDAMTARATVRKFGKRDLDHFVNFFSYHTATAGTNNLSLPHIISRIDIADINA